MVMMVVMVALPEGHSLGRRAARTAAAAPPPRTAAAPPPLPRDLTSGHHELHMARVPQGRQAHQGHHARCASSSRAQGRVLRPASECRAPCARDAT